MTTTTDRLCYESGERVSSVRERLTVRENQVAQLVRAAKPSRYIARELDLTEGTVKAYLHNIFRKLGIKNRTELAMWLVENEG